MDDMALPMAIAHFKCGAVPIPLNGMMNEIRAETCVIWQGKIIDGHAFQFAMTIAKDCAHFFVDLQ